MLLLQKLQLPDQLRQQLEEQLAALSCVPKRISITSVGVPVRKRKNLLNMLLCKLVEQLLPVLDNFERALHDWRETEDFESLIKRSGNDFPAVDQVLEQEGLKEMEAVGQPFNPEYPSSGHEVEIAEHEEGIVVEEIQKGYMLKDKVFVQPWLK